jgi:hypothetical protein
MLAHLTPVVWPERISSELPGHPMSGKVKLLKVVRRMVMKALLLCYYPCPSPLDKATRTSQDIQGIVKNPIALSNCTHRNKISLFTALTLPNSNFKNQDNGISKQMFNL